MDQVSGNHSLRFPVMIVDGINNGLSRPSGKCWGCSVSPFIVVNLKDSGVYQGILPYTYMYCCHTAEHTPPS
jgi:hypothetical protein